MAFIVFICLSAALSREEFPGVTCLSFPQGRRFLTLFYFICSSRLTCVLYLPSLGINSFLWLFVIFKISPYPFSQVFQMPSEIPYLT